MNLLQKAVTTASNIMTAATSASKIKKIPLHLKLPVQISPCVHCRATHWHAIECPEQPTTEEYVQYLREQITSLKIDNKRYCDSMRNSFRERERWEGKFRIVCHENNKLRAKFQSSRKTGRGDLVNDEVEGFMPLDRWTSLMKGSPAKPMTVEEIEAGWHYCPEWDGLLIGPGMSEEDACTCPTPAKRKVKGLCDE